MNGVRYYRFKLGNDDWKNRISKSKFAKFEGFGTAGSHICLQVMVTKLVTGISNSGNSRRWNGTAPNDGSLDLKVNWHFPT